MNSFPLTIRQFTIANLPLFSFANIAIYICRLLFSIKNLHNRIIIFTFATSNFEIKIMESNEKSPIIERLCKFIDASGLTNSQFADRAGIPRPSMSQMLHGRNKSLNNHVLSKLNDAFPELNIVWLLFGRGDMLSYTNSETSEPQNTLFPTSQSDVQIDNQEFNIGRSKNETATLFEQNRTNELNSADFGIFAPTPQPASQNEAPKSGSTSDSSDSSDAEMFTRIINSKIVDKEPAKKIASIIVLFTDNSFKTFVPLTNN